MELIILPVVLGIVFFVAILGVGYLLLGKLNIKKRLNPDAPPDAEDQKVSRWEKIQKGYEKVVTPLGELIPRPIEEMTKQELRLVKAGIRRKDSVKMFYGAKLLMIIVFLLLLVATGLLTKNIMLFILLAIFFGLLIPDLWLKYTIAKRTEKIQKALPNALDLAVVCIEAGMGLDQAFMRIGKEMRKGFPELSDEFNVLNLEVRAGRTRADALRNLAKRTGSQDLKSLVAVLVQTDRFGTSIAQSLRTFADTMRTTRRLRAEEHAAKMTIKMIPPLVFFIFPVIMIIVLGPGFVQIREVLFKTFKGN